MLKVNNAVFVRTQLVYNIYVRIKHKHYYTSTDKHTLIATPK